MSPILTFGAANPITKISVGTLEDIGYTVDYTMAEDLTSYSLNKTACCATRWSDYGTRVCIRLEIIPRMARFATGRDS
jgi:hypothetical protein